MTREVINVGAAPNDGTGDPIRTAYIKCNNNFSELYSRVQDSPPPTLVGLPGDTAGMYAYDSNYFYYCFQDYDGSSIIWAQISDSVPSGLSNGTSSVQAFASGNITVNPAGVSNVAIFAPSGTQLTNVDITGTLDVTGNLSAANLTISDELGVFGTVTMANLLPWSNVTFDLGSANLAWRDLYLSGNSIYLGAAQITANATTITMTTGDGTEFVVAGAGGGGNATANFSSVTVSGNVDAGNVMASGMIAAAGNISGQYVLGDGSFLTNVTAVSNVAVTQISNGTSVVSFTDTNGPLGIAINGVANVGVFTASGFYVGGLLDVTGTASIDGLVTAGNLNTAGQVSAATVTAATGNYSSLVSVTGTTPATSTTTGSLRTLGGLGVQGNAHIGGLAAISGNLSAGNVTAASAAFTSLSGTLTTASQTNITAIGTLASLAVSGNTTTGGLSVTNSLSGANLSISGNITAANVSVSETTTTSFLNVGSLINVTATGESVSTTSGAVRIAGGMGIAGNIYSGGQIVATSSIQGSILITGSDITKTNGNGVGNIGTTSNRFNTVFARATSAQYADLAEIYVADRDYEPGTVVKFGGTYEITICNSDADAAVAGVISSEPAYVMNAAQMGEHALAVALVGKVPCRVVGSVRKGQMLVSAGAGVARAENSPMMGTVIGKSLEDFDGEHGTIMVVVGRL